MTMLNKLILGTANFINPYGIYSDGHTIDNEIIQDIFKTAQEWNVNIFDTAFVYGDFFSLLNKNFNLSNLKIITKFNIIDDYDVILKRIQYAKEKYNFNEYYGLLIHDPWNLSKIDTRKMFNFFEIIKKQDLVKKIGISIYDMDDFENFKQFVDPEFIELIQIPLNPLNQTFINNKFLDYTLQNNIEVHARSLFLQGVLLSDRVPKALRELEPLWNIFIDGAKCYSSRLEALLCWGFSQNAINKWILGVASLENFLNILQQSQNINVENIKQSNSFDVLKNISHPLVDPRNWNFL